MKITQLFLKNYGPIQEKNYQFKSGFNLLFGKNEQGKSLSFDALIKLLFGKTSRKLSFIDRVSDDPASYGGFVEFEHEKDGKIIKSKIQGKPNLSEIIDLELDTCNNLFLIRNSELSIGQDAKDQDRFYTSLTDKLTGLKTEEIAQAKQKLQNFAQLTNTNRFQSTQENNRLAERLEKARQLLTTDGKIPKLIAQDKQQGWSQLEEQLRQSDLELKEIIIKIQQQTSAKNKEQYLELKNQLQIIDQLNDQLTPLQNINQEFLENLRLTQQEEKRLQLEQEEIKKELEEKKTAAQKIERELKTLDKEIEENSSAREEIENSLQPESMLLIKKFASIQASQNQPWKKLLLLFTGLLLISLLVFLIQPQLIILLISIIITTGLVIFSLKYFSQLKQQQQFDTRLNQLRLDLAKYKITAKTLEEVSQQINQLKQKFNSLISQKSVLSSQHKATRDDVSYLRDKKLSLNNSLLIKQQDLIKNINQECSIKSEKELREKLLQKNDFESKLQRMLAMMESRLGKPTTDQDPAEFFKKQLSNQTYLDLIQLKVKYNPKVIESLQQQQVKLEQEIQDSRQQLAQLKEELQDIQREASTVFNNRPQPLIIDNISDLLQVKRFLVNFFNSHLSRRKQVIKLLSLLDELEIQEKQKIGQLFGENSSISQAFSKITDQHYQQVFYDQDNHQIMVKLNDGHELKAEQLSSGTYDQLFFAIRVGLGTKLLNDQTGFFIMDDPFLKADQERLGKQLDALLKLSGQGWQIIYFSAKDEVKNYLTSKKINLIKIKDN